MILSTENLSLDKTDKNVRGLLLEENQNNEVNRLIEKGSTTNLEGQTEAYGGSGEPGVGF